MSEPTAAYKGAYRQKVRLHSGYDELRSAVLLRRDGEAEIK